MRILEPSRTFSQKGEVLSAIKNKESQSQQAAGYSLSLKLRKTQQAAEYGLSLSNQKLKILEVTTYTAGGCGVAARVKQEASLLAKRGHTIMIFSTDQVKGTHEKAPRQEKIEEITICRFPCFKLGGESFTYWDFTQAAHEFKPDVIIVHAYRHTHTTRALRIAKQRKIPCLLVTHAPFSTGGESRSLLAKLSVAFYDAFIGPSTLKKFTRIIAITHWERATLKVLGVPEKNIVYIPNGIPSLFFTQKKAKEEKNKILYFGRVSPIKDLETLIEAFSLLPPNIQNSLTLEIAGPAEALYLSKLKSLASSLNISKKIIFSPAIYNTKKKISKLDSATIYVLPSIREGMPQTLIEALARGKIVVASNNLGNSAIIQDDKNGFLFSVGDTKALASLISFLLTLSPAEKARIQKAARSSVKKFAWPHLIEQLDSLLKETVQTSRSYRKSL